MNNTSIFAVVFTAAMLGCIISTLVKLSMAVECMNAAFPAAM